MAQQQGALEIIVEKVCERYNLPHNISIFGHNIEVVIADDLKGKDGEKRWGECDFSSPPQIRVDSSSSNIRAYQTFVHEVIEFINAEMELELSHPNITRLELGLANFLLNNKIDWEYANGSND